MKQAVRFRTIVTGFMVIAALTPILMTSLVRNREGLDAEAAATERAKRDVQVAVRLIEHELEQVRAQFAATQQAAGRAGAISRMQLTQLLQAPGAAPTFRALYVVDTRGVTHLYDSAGDGHPVFWTLPEVPPTGSAVLLTAPAPDHRELPLLAFAGALPEQPGQMLVAELRTERLRALLQAQGEASGLVLLVSGAGGGQPADGAGSADLPPVSAAGGLLEIRAYRLETALAESSWSWLWVSLATGGLSVAVAWVLGHTLIAQFQRPMAALLEVSDLLAHGRSGAPIPPPPGLAPLELHRLIDRFNDLSERLGDTHGALVETNQSLEQRVAERTRELARRNVDLGYSRATLYAVMESMTDGIVLITPDDRIRYISRHTEALLHLGEAFFPGRPATELYAAVVRACENPDDIRKLLEEPRSESGPGEVVLTVRSGSRSPRYLRWRTFPIRNATGADLGLGHILTDVTQEREIDRVKSELISIVSHELRTPLTAIRASASSLLRPDVEWDDETRSDFLQTISEESRHLQELIENLLDMSKIEAGVLKLDLHPTDAGQLVESAASRARAIYPDWQLTVSVPPGLPPVRVDPRRMEQVLLNLVDNAVKYGADSRKVEIRAHRQPDEVWLSVYDEGIGIPPEHLELIFQRFHRVDSRLTRDTGGSGLGLAISRGIIEAHGGRIWATSEPGRGSTFYIALPIAHEEGDSDEV